MRAPCAGLKNSPPPLSQKISHSDDATLKITIMGSVHSDDVRLRHYSVEFGTSVMRRKKAHVLFAGKMVLSLFKFIRLKVLVWIYGIKFFEFCQWLECPIVFFFVPRWCRGEHFIFHLNQVTPTLGQPFLRPSSNFLCYLVAILDSSENKPNFAIFAVVFTGQSVVWHLLSFSVDGRISNNFLLVLIEKSLQGTVISLFKSCTTWRLRSYYVVRL